MFDFSDVFTLIYLMKIDFNIFYPIVLILLNGSVIYMNLKNIRKIKDSKIREWINKLPLDLVERGGFFEKMRCLNLIRFF